MDLEDSSLFNLLLSHVSIGVSVHDIVQQVIDILYFRDGRYEDHNLAMRQDCNIRDGKW